MGGIGERQIRTARSILKALRKTYAGSFYNEAPHKLLIEIKVNANTRLMTTETINNVQSYVPLFPSNLLTMQLKVVMPQPESIWSVDTYGCKRWKKIKHIVNEF